MRLRLADMLNVAVSAWFDELLHGCCVAMALDMASVAHSAVLWPLKRAVAGMMDPLSG